MPPPTIKKAAELDKPRSILIHAEPGHGKTHLLSSIAGVKGIRTVTYVDIDGGSGVFAKDWPDIDVVTFKRLDIEGFQTWWADYVKKGGNGADATVIDTGTVLQQWKLRSLPKSLGWDRIEMATDFITDVLWDLHFLPGVGLSAFHAEVGNTVRGADGKEYIKLGPASQGKQVKTLIPAIPDIIGFLEDDGEDYILSLRPNEEAVSKKRFKTLPDKIKNTSMKRIYELIDGKPTK